MSDNNIFGERLKMLRIEKDMFQEELGKLVGVKKAMISRYEIGENEPGMRVAKKLANYFHVSFDYLDGTSDEREPVKQSFQRIFESLSEKKQLDAIKYMEFLKSKDE